MPDETTPGAEMASFLSAFDAAGRLDQLEQDHADAMGRLLLEVIDLADSLDRLCGDGDGESASGRGDSMRALREQFREMLRRQGVVVVDCVGKPFDPQLHEAVATAPVEAAAVDTVVGQQLTGYVWNGRLLRPPRVVVGRQAV